MFYYIFALTDLFLNNTVLRIIFCKFHHLLFYVNMFHLKVDVIPVLWTESCLCGCYCDSSEQWGHYIKDSAESSLTHVMLFYDVRAAAVQIISKKNNIKVEKDKNRITNSWETAIFCTLVQCGNLFNILYHVKKM